MRVGDAIRGAKSAVQTTAGLHRADERTVRLRLATCGACPNRRTTAGIDRCGLCECILKLKSRDARESCPLGYWNV